MLAEYAMHVDEAREVCLQREMPVAAYAQRARTKSACLAAGGARC
jgi:hypothetical protein